MFSAMIIAALTMVVSLANTALAVPAESPLPSAYQEQPYYYYYQPSISNQNYVRTRSAGSATYTPIQSAPVAAYQTPPAYYYQSSAASDSYVQAGSAKPAPVYAQPPSAKTYSQRRPVQHPQPPSFPAQQVKQSPGKRPYYYKAWHYY